jgi:pyruvate formate lyase activating enzyme
MQTKLHIALDTSGSVLNERVEKLISMCDLIMLDIKFTSNEDYKKFTGGTLTQTLEFLDKCQKLSKEVWIRHVVVPTLNDSDEDIMRLKEIIAPYDNISRVELLPFKKLCLEKYESLSIPFPLYDIPECDSKTIDRLYKILDNE